MTNELQSLDLIDLLSERHVRLRLLCNRLWNESHDLHLSNSEWFIMARIYKKFPTIAYVTKHVDISRQATHKFIRSLEAKGLVEISNSHNNNKEKCLRLTEFGESCFEKNEIIKESLEKKIIETIGIDQVNRLKNLLEANWGL